MLVPGLGRECLVWLCVWHKPQVTKIPRCTGVMVSASSGNMYRHMVMALWFTYQLSSVSKSLVGLDMGPWPRHQVLGLGLGSYSLCEHHCWKALTTTMTTCSRTDWRQNTKIWSWMSSDPVAIGHSPLGSWCRGLCTALAGYLAVDDAAATVTVELVHRLLMRLLRAAYRCSWCRCLLVKRVSFLIVRLI